MTILQHYRCFPWAYITGSSSWTKVNNNPNLNIQDFTLVVAVNSRYQTGEHTILSKYLQYRIFYRMDSTYGNRIWVRLYENGTFYGYFTDDGEYPKEGEWTHIVITYDSSYIRWYLNNTKVHELAVSRSIDSGTNDLYIGQSGITSALMKGFIAYLLFYDIALNDSQATKTFNNPYDPPKKDKIVLWFDNRSFTQSKWVDLSGNENHGTPNNVQLKHQPQYLTNYKTLTNFKIPA